MIKYRCQLCGRIHYGRIGLRAGYCTTCGPKGGLIMDIDWGDWERMTKVVTKAINEATKGFKELAVAMGKVSRNIK